MTMRSILIHKHDPRLFEPTEGKVLCIVPRTCKHKIEREANLSFTKNMLLLVILLTANA